MAVVVAALVGLLVGIAATLLIRRRGDAPAVAPSRLGRASGGPVEVAPADQVVQLLPTAVVIVDLDDAVIVSNPAALRMGVVTDGRLTVPTLLQLVRTTRRTGTAQGAELTMDTGSFPHRERIVGGRTEPLAAGDVALVLDDLTEAKRVEAVRRDFVANVGHEIKTPVGALQLLAEAALDARDDPTDVQRFVGRMQHEAQRLARLVQELLDLSRLQGGEPLPDNTRVSVDAVLDEAIDRARPAADARRISMVRFGVTGVTVRGVESQLVTAVANVLDNAISYSPESTHVAIGVQFSDDVAEITVTDEGIGIAKAEQERIFERFYRVDPARSRATGGTGLGLAIVKHTIGNHGGDVTVWSRPGSGSTFTIRLAAGPARQEALTP